MPYSLTEYEINLIAEKFNTTKENIEKIRDKFDKSFLDDDANLFKNEYLAHLIRSMERVLREKTKNPLFRIIVEALREEDPLHHAGTADYKVGKYFAVFYHPLMEPKQLRICLAHELGHLFLAALMEAPDSEEFSSEPIASVFGILAILQKNWFYSGECEKFNHDNTKALISDFCLMANRSQGIHNLS